MLGWWRRLNKEKTFDFLIGRRRILSFENGSWEFIPGRAQHKINIPAIFLKELLFMDNFRGSNR